MNRSSKLVTILALSTAVALSIGCGEQLQPPTHSPDETEARAAESTMLSKLDFTDVAWYIQKTLIDVPYGAGRGFTGFPTRMEKVRWEINEEFLIAYRAYEQRPGSHAEAVLDEHGETHYAPGQEEGYGEGYKEEPIAMYRILEHLHDEQQCERRGCSHGLLPLERNAMRVDWTDQLDGSLFFGFGTQDGVGYSVSPHEPTRDAFQFDYFDDEAAQMPGRAPGDHPHSRLYYFDFTNRVSLKPMSSTIYDCTPLSALFALDDNAYEIRVRTSVLRVPEQSDYEPVTYDKTDFHKFGYFLTERTVYDPYHAETSSGRIVLANRHNIWSDTWERDDDGHIRLDDEGRRIPKPFAERTPRPIVYHLSQDFPSELNGPAHEVIDGWDVAMKRTVATAQDRPVETVPRMVVLCHNPVSQADPDVCGPTGTEARSGDIRFHHFAYIHSPQTCGPLGYGPSSPDPETGELITSLAGIYGASLDRSAQRALEMVMFTNGDLDLPGLRNADDVREAIAARANPAIDPSAVTLSQDHVAPLPDSGFASTLGEGASARLDAADLQGPSLSEWRDRRTAALAESGLAALATGDELGALGEMGHDAPFIEGGHVDFGAFGEVGAHHLVSPQSGCFLQGEQVDDALLGIASRFFGRTDYDAVRDELKALIFISVQAHEVGHTLGLRHNFAGSADYLNYSDTYWDLKGAGVIGVDPATFQLALMPLLRPLFIDDIFWMTQQTPDQALGGMREHQYTSIMDYSSRFNTDSHGLGRYDHAAILYGYTTGRNLSVSQIQQGVPGYNQQERGYVEVFENAGDAAEILAHFEVDLRPEQDAAVESFHYQTLGTWLASDGAAWHLGQQPTPSPDPGVSLATFLDRLRTRGVMRYDDVLAERQASLDQTGLPWVNRRVEVPYLFLSDEFANTKQSARRSDLGSTPLEQAQDIAGRYRGDYPFIYFHRDRLYHEPVSAANRILWRYTSLMREGADRWIESTFKPLYDNVLAYDREWAGIVSMNAMAEVLTTPRDGSYVANGDVYEFIGRDEIPGADLYVPPGLGRAWDSRFAVTDGSIFPYALDELGHYWGSLAAMEAMLAIPTFILLPEGGYGTLSANAFDVFRDETTRLLNALIAQDSSVFGHRVVPDGQGGLRAERALFLAPQVAPGLFLDVETFQLAPPPMASDLTRTVLPHLGSASGYTQKITAALYGMAYMASPTPSGFGLKFQDQARIFRVGSGEENAPGPGFITLTFCDPDPATGICYGANVSQTDTDPGLAPRLILRAQARAASFLPGDPQLPFAVEGDIQDMDLMRTLYEVFGQVHIP